MAKFKVRMAIWECDRCKDRTIEAVGEETGAYNEKMPSGGWACRKINCGMLGIRKFKSWAKYTK